MYFSFDYLSKVISNIFDVIDIVEKFSINGGEPLLHPQLPEIINQSNAENDEEMLPHVHMIASLLKR
jgi:molybdenum cofactor biosynthesis enzyme MoaA